jgi:hypothetical protein
MALLRLVEQSPAKAGRAIAIHWHALCVKSALRHCGEFTRKEFYNDYIATYRRRRQTVYPYPFGTDPHTHDHYHVTHHHVSGVAGALAEFEHRAYWHTHEHNHTELTHSHDYDQVSEGTDHAKEAHIHDHAAPTHSHT